MERQIATTREQSDRLLQCGVPAESADMCYQFIDDCANNTDKPICNTPKEQYNTLIGYGFGDSRIHITPAWSLGALLGLFSQEMGIAVGAYPGSNKYTCFTLIDPDIEPIVADTAIEAVVLMTEQLTAQGYRLNGIEKGGEA